MTPEDKKLIVDALMSGEYKQVHLALGRMKGGEEYNCCLGVMCRIFKSHRTENTTTVLYDGENAMLPSKLCARLGIDDLGTLPKPYWVNGIQYGSLSSLNDNGVDFKTIAKVIDESF